MSRRLIIALIIAGAGKLPAQPVLVNAIAAKVGKRLITVQDAYFYRGLQRLRGGERPVVLLETDKNLKNTVQKVMFEEMILEEAKAVDFKDPDSKQTSEAVKKVKSQGQGKDWLTLIRAFSLTESEGEKRVTQGILAEKFLKKKIDSLTPLITDSEIEQYAKNYPEKVRNLGEKSRTLIEEALKKDKIDKGLQDYIDFLREKYSAAVLLF